MIDVLKYILIGVVSYLLGSLSTGILVASRAGHDIRSVSYDLAGTDLCQRTLPEKFHIFRVH